MSAIDRPFRPRTARRRRAVEAAPPGTVVRRSSAAVVVSGIVALLVGFSPAAAFADSVRRDQWQIRELDARTAWDLSSGDGVTVAVIDSGVDATHPDLIGQVLPGADFVDGTSDGRVDPVGHGTTVAGLIAGRDDDSSGVVGLAPHAKILPIRVLDKNNRYDDPATVAKGINWAVDHGATVINLSLGGQLRSDVLADALAYAAVHDVVVIACTGNVAAGSTDREVWYPAREAGVVAVAGLVGADATPAPSADRPVSGGGGGGSGSNESLWNGSLTGSPTVLTAPAVNLLGAKAGGGYWRVQGTSFAAPLVAASASLIRSRYPSMTAPNVINRLISTARDLGKPGRDDQYGYGEVDPVGALRAEVTTVKANPLGEVPPPATAAPTTSPTTKSSGQGSDVPGHAAASKAPAAPDQATDGMGLAARAAAMERRLGPSAAIGTLVAAVLFVLGLMLTRRQRPAPRHSRRR
jgi:type VII secretion-associated serine protease mycosin